MPERPPETESDPDEDDTDAGYRDTLEEQAYQQAVDDAPDGDDEDDAA